MPYSVENMFLSHRKSYVYILIISEVETLLKEPKRNFVHRLQCVWIFLCLSMQSPIVWSSQKVLNRTSPREVHLEYENCTYSCYYLFLNCADNRLTHRHTDRTATKNIVFWIQETVKHINSLKTQFRKFNLKAVLSP